MTQIVLQGDYDIDPDHTAVYIEARHAMVTKIRGVFDDWEGTFSVGENLHDLKLTATVRASSINTGVPPRDVHLRSADFLDVREYPEITFESTNAWLDDELHGKVEGTLTLKGIARHEVFSLTLGGADIDPYGKYRVGFEARTEIDRRDYGVMFQTMLESGGVLVSDNVTIVIDGSIVYRDPEPESGAGEF